MFYNLTKLNYKSTAGYLIRLPLRLIPSNSIVRIMSGTLKGMKWVKGSGTNGCWLGTYEAVKQNKFVEMITPGSIIFDIGANVGIYTLVASVLTGKDGRVYAFEPLEENLLYLRKHISINNINNVEVLPFAVSNCSGSLSFEKNRDRFQGKLSEAGTIKVNSIRIDDFVKANNVKPDILKIDIEGGEYDALLGSIVTLSEYRPVIFLATHGKEVHKKCMDLLISIGYKLEPLGEKPVEENDEIIATFPR